MNKQRVIEKAVDFEGSIKKLLNYIKNYYKYFVIVIILGFISSIFTIIGPNILSDLVNLITEGILSTMNLEKITNIIILLAILYLLSAIFSYIQSYLTIDVTNKLAFNLRKEISEKINKLPLKYFDKISYGDVLSRVTNDVDTISQTLNNSLSNLYQV